MTLNQIDIVGKTKIMALAHEFLLAFAVLLCLSIALPVKAQTPALIDKDVVMGSTLHREVVDANLYPWRAVGRVNVVTGSHSRQHCTGALIGPRVVLTAAHCLYINELRGWVRPQYVHFVAGYQRDNYIRHSVGEKIIIADELDKFDKTAFSLFNDWALVILEKPIGEEVGYLPIRPLTSRDARNIVRKNQPLAIVGYPRDRQFVMSLDKNCEFAGFSHGERLMRHRCTIVNGDSGAPVGLYHADGSFTIVGVNSAASRDIYGDHLNAAIPLRNIINALEREGLTNQITLAMDDINQLVTTSD